MNIVEYQAGNYDRSEFYSVVGKYFAERKYRKEMPYLVNDDNKSWVLFYSDNALVGFYAYEKKKHITEISGFYVVEEFRNHGFSKEMVNNITCNFDSCKITTNLHKMVSVLNRYGFEKSGQKGSYETFKWRKDDGSKECNM